ncbi:MAG: hypothetical protein LBC89_01430, partial [Bacteroidales bacterium]|nr:hypothetical protein [Bacteroidales bacterium]
PKHSTACPVVGADTVTVRFSAAYDIAFDLQQMIGYIEYGLGMSNQSCSIRTSSLNKNKLLFATTSVPFSVG